MAKKNTENLETEEELETDDVELEDDKDLKDDNIEDEGENEVEKWKQIAKKWEARSKENFEKAKKTPTLEEKLNLTLSQFKEIQDENLLLKKKAIGSKYGLPDELVDLLKGKKDADLEAHAKKLSELFPATKHAKIKPNVKPLLTQGNSDENKTSAGGTIQSKEDYIAFLKSKM